MEVIQPDPTAGLIQLLLLVAFIVPAIFFLISQQNTLKAIQPANRATSPGMVWLQLIPLVNLVFQFFVVNWIANSIQRELATRDAAAQLSAGVSKRKPTQDKGIAYCIFWILFLASSSLSPLMRLPLLLVSTFCWILYWVELVQYKKKIQQPVAG